MHLSQLKKGLPLGSLSATDTWNEQMGVEGTTGTITTNGSIIATGNIFTTNGNISATTGSISGRDISSSTTITATGNITGSIGTFKYIACTGTSGRPITPSGYGAYLGCDGTNYCALELSCDLMSYIDFTSPGVDYKGRFQFLNASTTFQWFTGASNRMTLSPTGLVVNGTTVSSSDEIEI